MMPPGIRAAARARALHCATPSFLARFWVLAVFAAAALLPGRYGRVTLTMLTG